VHEVGIGGADMCFGNFWPTAQRKKVASFASTIYRDTFHLIVFQDKASTTLDFAKPFAPFATELWLLIFSIFGVVGVLMTREVAIAAHGKSPSWCQLISSTPMAVFKGWHGFNTGEVKGLDVKTSGGWLSQWAVGFTKTILLAGYVSVMVSVLVKASTTQVESFDHAIRQGMKICTNPNLQPSLVGEYPKLMPLLVTDASSGQAGLLESMDQGLCDAALIDADLWAKYRTFGQIDHCESKVRLLETVSMQDNSIPVRDELVPAMSWAITRAVEAGKYAPLVKQARGNYTYDICPEAPMVMKGARSLGVSDLGAPLIFLAIVSVLSLVLTRLGGKFIMKAEEVKEVVAPGASKVSTRDLWRHVIDGTQTARQRGKNEAADEKRRADVATSAAGGAAADSSTSIHCSQI